VTLPLRTLDELLDAATAARHATRRVARQDALLRRVWHALLACGAPVAVDLLAREAIGLEIGTVRERLARLDADDLLLIQDGLVRLAYPLSGDPTPFTVALADGRTRFACCAVDALGIAPMLGRPVEVRAACHHCGAPLRFPVQPDGPGPGAGGVVVWIGARDPDERRACTGH
jgi:hypothetical protein